MSLILKTRKLVNYTLPKFILTHYSNNNENDDDNSINNFTYKVC